MTMRRVLWRDGRLSWGVVGVIVFLTASLIAIDLAWRLIRLQFDTFLLYAGLIDLGAALALVLATMLWSRTLRRFRL
jgi:hypothetical protein